MKVTSNSKMKCSGDETVWPPGFRFHPTDEELVLYYLKRKICGRRLKLDIIGETDVYKWDPEDLPGLSMLKTGDRQWFFFSPRDRKYPNGARSNRATQHGYWKATGKDRIIKCNSRTVGVKKTLVFYKGRAPNGERTDWVMHEYTLDEDELKRCQTAGDYFALYKAFKKSGPGPKNGEQYGAPFKEEDWTDDEIPEVNNHIVDWENPVKQIDDVAPVHNLGADGRVQSSPNGVEKIMNPIADEHALDQQHTVGYTYTLPQIVGEEESVSAMADPSVWETIFSDRSVVLHSTSQQGVEASFDFTQSTTSQLHEASEVTSVPNINEQDPQISEEDFLEIDDLIGPDPTFSKDQQLAQNLQFEELDGLSELDLYHDAAMFLRDIGPIDQGIVSDPYLNSLENEMVNHLGYQLQSQLEGTDQGVVSDPYLKTLENEVVNHLGYQLQSNLDGVDQICNQLWTHDQSSNVFTSQESIQGAISLPNPGVVCTGSSTNIPTGTTQNQSGKQNDGAQSSWFTTSLWGFVESIPTTPASASENMNRAFERVSSFSRVRLSARNTNGNGDATVRRAGNNSRFFFLSVIGVLCALLWVLMIGTSMRDLGRYISL